SRLLSGLFGEHGYVRVDGRVVPFDLTQVRFHQLQRRNLLRPDGGNHFRQRQVVRHRNQCTAIRMGHVATMSFEEARACVLEEVRAARSETPTEMVSLLDSAGRVLAADYRADRDYPAANRSVRDGFAIRSRDSGGEHRVTGEVRAGASFEGEVGPAEAVEIMTGAPVPAG